MEGQCFGGVENRRCSFVAYYFYPVMRNGNPDRCMTDLCKRGIAAVAAERGHAFMMYNSVSKTTSCIDEIVFLKILFTLSSYPGEQACNLCGAFSCRILCELQRHALLQPSGQLWCGLWNPRAAICHCWLCHCTCQPS